MLLAVRVALVARRQMEYLVLAPPRSLRFGCWERSTPPWLDHPFDHPDDPTGPYSIRLDRRGTQREQARSDWSRPDRRSAPGYGSGGWGFESLAARNEAICALLSALSMPFR